MSLERRRDLFDDPEWIFQLKYDAYRELAFMSGTKLVSRRGLEYHRFWDLRADLSDEAAEPPFIVSAIPSPVTAKRLRAKSGTTPSGHSRPRGDLRYPDDALYFTLQDRVPETRDGVTVRGANRPLFDGHL